MAAIVRKPRCASEQQSSAQTGPHIAHVVLGGVISWTIIVLLRGSIGFVLLFLHYLLQRFCW
jgi:hypothetical protein